jgi:hypothetical protein
MYRNLPFQLELQIDTISRIDEILVGALVAIYHFNHKIEPNIDRKTRLVIYFFFLILLTIKSINNFESGLFGILFKKYIYLGFIVFWQTN